MSKKELNDYRSWFMEVLPDRINQLTDVVRQMPGFEIWQPDKTPNSLDTLGEWLSGQVETRLRSQAELHEIKSRPMHPIDGSATELTNRTFSLAMDTGMYLSQVFLQNNPSLRWSQDFGNKKFIDYGQPVLVEFTPSPFNPVRMVITFAYGLVNKTRTGQGLREIYEIWAKLVRTNVKTIEI